MSDAADMSDMGFKLVQFGGNESVYQKWNKHTLTRTTVTIWGQGEGKFMNVKHEQPKWVQNVIIDDNVARQNSFTGYTSGMEAYNAVRAPMPVWQQIMKKCGFKQGQGYDQKKFRQIANDSDYSKLKVIPGKI
jgi:hypothetical protein|tara:strand:+ start:486 stop:884 length:399 start_codon:yes stop_codon:yes gene_type:complete